MMADMLDVTTEIITCDTVRLAHAHIYQLCNVAYYNICKTDEDHTVILCDIQIQEPKDNIDKKSQHATRQSEVEQPSADRSRLKYRHYYNKGIPSCTQHREINSDVN